jgi:hypothetical protein
MEYIADKVIEEHYGELGWIKDCGIRIAYVTSDKEKKSDGRLVYGECTKANPTVAELGDCDFIITFYIPNIRYFTDKQLDILMFHELLHAGEKDGNTAIEPHDYVIMDFKTIVEKFGADWSQPKEYTDRSLMWYGYESDSEGPDGDAGEENK